MRWLMLSLTLSCGTALAQQWPAKPVRLISQVAAGAVTDIVARVYAEPMGRALGQPWLVENRPGADGLVSLEATARAAPDGYTYVMSSQSLAINPYTLKDMKFDWTKELAPVATIVDLTAFALVANAALPANNLPELIALAKKQPGKLSYGVSVPISAMFAQWVSKQAGIEMLEVPYKTTRNMLTDTISGQTSMSVMSLPGIHELVRAGKVKVLTVTSAQRMKGWEDVPTAGETFPGFTMSGFIVLLAPRATSNEILQRVARASDAVVKDPAFNAKLGEFGWANLNGARTPEGTAEYIRTESERWRQILKVIGVKLQ
jgi:tripartite-type tricarboxylate transporter receptor subunit TctC